MHVSLFVAYFDLMWPIFEFDLFIFRDIICLFKTCDKLLEVVLKEID